MCLGEDRHPRQTLVDRTGQRVKSTNVFDFFIEELDADGQFIGFGRKDIDHVTTYPISTALEINVVTRVLQFCQLSQNPPLIDDLTP